MKNFIRKNLVFVVAIGFLLLGVLLGVFIPTVKLFRGATAINEIRSGQNNLINPLLECSMPETDFTELDPFQDKITLLASNLQSSGAVNSVSVYFQDLDNGPWFGVHPLATFSPASLLKLPLAIAYYKLSEGKDPQILQKTITYTGPNSDWPPITQDIAPAQTLVVGQTYTNEQLIERMLEYSDNVSYYLLFTNVDVNFLNNVYNDFGMQINGPGSADDSLVTVKDYSSFFRILFNASYLNQGDSEKLLSLLASSEYNQGLVAGVQVAHKFGERESTTDNSVQLSDCGIVYYPQHPYLLCISTKGTDINQQGGAIESLSSAVYNQVYNQYTNPNSGN
jgi:beta-lactamase class A